MSNSSGEVEIPPDEDEDPLAASNEIKTECLNDDDEEEEEEEEENNDEDDEPLGVIVIPKFNYIFSKVMDDKSDTAIKFTAEKTFLEKHLPSKLVYKYALDPVISLQDALPKEELPKKKRKYVRRRKSEHDEEEEFVDQEEDSDQYRNEFPEGKPTVPKVLKRRSGRKPKVELKEESLDDYGDWEEEIQDLLFTTPDVYENDASSENEEVKSAIPIKSELPDVDWNSEATDLEVVKDCLLYTSPSPRDRQKSRMPSSA